MPAYLKPSVRLDERDAGLSRESLYRALSENGNPSFATVLKIAKAVGVRLHAEAV
jgi:probable addiction module antidote protein